jgi:Aerotolerance regulator N-terminal
MAVMTFSSPAALWCLLGIPVVLAIHFLQKRSQREVITTLFLLQQLRRESEVGNRIERLRPSIPLWLQLLMVLLFTWLLAGPRWMKKEMVQRMVIVMDSSASMQAFRAEAEAAVRTVLATLAGPLTRTELTLLASDPAQPAYYHGGSATELELGLKSWLPLLGVHDFTPSLRTARHLAGEKGSVVFITDHVSESKLPFEAALFAVGSDTPNVGWAGVTVEEKDGRKIWRALLCNHSRTAQDREWRAGSGDKLSAWTKLTLAVGETRTLSGPFLEGADVSGLRLELKPDAFTLDDVLPVLSPKPKVLGLHLPSGRGDGAEELRELFGKFAHTQIVASAEADVRVIVWPPSTALGGNENACVFSSPSKIERVALLRGAIVGEAHPLIEGLNWQSLLVHDGMVVPRDVKDRVLLWQGERPLISLRRTELGAQQLFCHFDLISSNARKLPALAVLLHRFLQQMRQEKVAPETENYDLRQRLSVAHHQGEKAAPLTLVTQTPAARIEVPLAQAHLLRAPAQPGFFQVEQAGEVLLRGSAHFADTREADLKAGKAFQDLASLKTEQSDAVMESDPRWRLWLLILLAALLGSWWWGRANLAKALRVDSASGSAARA